MLFSAYNSGIRCSFKKKRGMIKVTGAICKPDSMIALLSAFHWIASLCFLGAEPLRAVRNLTSAE